MKKLKWGPNVKNNPPCGGHRSEVGNKYRCVSWACSTVSDARRFKALEKDAIQEGILDGLYLVDGHYRSEHLDKKDAA